MTNARGALLGIAVLLSLYSPGCRGRPPAPPSEARLVADMESIQPGEPFMLGVLITLQEGWHTYWSNPGDSGMAPHLEWKMPEGFTAGPIQWPAPRRLEDPPLVTFGYEKEVLLFREIRPPAHLPAGEPVTFEVEASWLICRQECLPQTAALRLTLPVNAGAPILSAGNEPFFTRASAHLPAVDPAWTFRATADPATLDLHVSPPPGISPDEVMEAVFFPARPDVVRNNSRVWMQANNEYLLRMGRTANATSLPDQLDGVLVVPAAGRPARAIEVHAAFQERQQPISNAEWKVTIIALTAMRGGTR